METSQPLSIESFSYSWLVNLKPSFEILDDTLCASIDASDEASFIEMDPKLPPSRRFFRGSHDFNFAFPISQQSPLTLVHADELISDGFLMPLFVKPLKIEPCDSSDSTPTTPISSHASKNVHSDSHCVENYKAEEDLAQEMKLLIIGYAQLRRLLGQAWLTQLMIGVGLVIRRVQYTRQSFTAKDQSVVTSHRGRDGGLLKLDLASLARSRLAAD
ncbi:hypothetical protein CsSME_00029267 [Camellia sinensis var. sinensis]